ncbi:hypothetical protein CAEBREN_05726 [Caenorhabditis brenneri]|uniref:Uncharacterized protein n=1 Tax=Caenorhabditis brenneri TaxID=135651 RepID=G0P2Z4_CAEBE|nr:hypothetical protein CAEBREN_05726 [Caenorhabditis brenneri]
MTLFSRTVGKPTGSPDEGLNSPDFFEFFHYTDRDLPSTGNKMKLKNSTKKSSRQLPQDSPPQDHQCFGAREHHARTNYGRSNTAEQIVIATSVHGSANRFVLWSNHTF